MITLYTPATGFPDLEVKIAYGLARVGIEAGANPIIIPYEGFYEVDLETSSEKFNETFYMLLNRLLSSERFFDLGVKAKDKKKYPSNKKVIERVKNKDLLNLYQLRTIEKFSFKKEKFCGHKEINKFGGSSGLILLTSFHAGKPYSRDKRFENFNLNLCEICAYLAVLGLYSFGLNIQMGTGKNKKYAIVLPIPTKRFSTEDLNVLLSLQKTLHNFRLSDLQPLKTFTIGLIAKVPSISDIVNDLQLNFHLSLVSKDNRGDTVVEQTLTINAIPFSKFISSSSYNIATVDNLLGSYRKNDQPKISSLIELVNIIEHKNKTSISKFARLYVQETSGNNFTNLLYSETAKYLLREVAMISHELIANPALNSLARTLRYFIREKKYGYADDIRNARKDSRDFEETIAKMLREGELRRVKQEQDKNQGKQITNWIHLPKDEEIKEVFNLANSDFESTKTALVILAFSFPTRVEDITTEPMEEVQNA